MSYTFNDALREGYTGKQALKCVQEAFNEGFTDGVRRNQHKDYDGVIGQAYDRGLLLGTKEWRRYQWANDPNVGE